MIGEGKDESIGPKGRGDNQKSDWSSKDWARDSKTKEANPQL